MYDDVTTAAVDRSDDALGPDRSCERLREIDVDDAVAKKSGADDHRVRTCGEHRLCAFNRPDAAADPAGESRTNRGDHWTVVALAFRRIEIDELHTGKP
jgi:hypothetical protein